MFRTVQPSTPKPPKKQYVTDNSKEQTVNTNSKSRGKKVPTCFSHSTKRKYLNTASIRAILLQKRNFFSDNQATVFGGHLNSTRMHAVRRDTQRPEGKRFAEQDAAGNSFWTTAYGLGSHSMKTDRHVLVLRRFATCKGWRIVWLS